MNFEVNKQITRPLIALFYYAKEQADRWNDVSAKIDIKIFMLIILFFQIF